KLDVEFEFVSYLGKLMNQYKQLSKDSLQLICYKKMIAQQERSSKALEYVFWLLSQKLAEEDEEEKKIINKLLKMALIPDISRHKDNIPKAKMNVVRSFFSSSLFSGGDILTHLQFSKDNNLVTTATVSDKPLTIRIGPEFKGEIVRKCCKRIRCRESMSRRACKMCTRLMKLGKRFVFEPLGHTVSLKNIS
nr:protein suppressor of gene silencing 3 [Tanacetum cinerariifolium]